MSQTTSESASGSQPTPKSCGAGVTQGHRLFCLSLETKLQEGWELPEDRDAEMIHGVKKKKVISSFNLEKGSLRIVLICDVKYQLQPRNIYQEPTAQLGWCYSQGILA